MIETFKDKHQGQTAIVFGTGPSLLKYDGRFNGDSILLGTNEIVYYPTVMDYYFIGDAGNNNRGYNSDPQTYEKYKPRIAKFYRRVDSNATLKYNPVPQEEIDVIYYEAKQKSGFRFFRTIPPFSDALSITFEVLQFTLMAGFKKVYLVGHDCTYDQGSFKTNDVNIGTKLHVVNTIQSWFMFYDMIKDRSDLEIINVNPVKMKLFKVIET